MKLPLLAILTAFLIGLAPATAIPAAAQTYNDEWIFVGDSITRVTMVSGASSFSNLVMARLEAGSKITEYNEAAIGMTTSRGLNQVKMR